MKILSLHCDYIRFKTLKKAIKEPEELHEYQKKQIEVKEALVILTAVEKQDEENPSLLNDYINEIKDLVKQINPKTIVLYPYAHLSSSLSKPSFASDILKKAENLLSKEYRVVRAPFGYYKEFELKCKGHPLSELSRTIGKSLDEVSDKKIQRDDMVNYKTLLKEISKAKLDTSKLKPNDHRIIGKQMDLFSFSELSP